MISLFDFRPLEWRLKRIEHKLDQLMERAGIEAERIPGVSKEASDSIMAFVLENKKIPAIKAYRDATGAPLKDAKSFIDDLFRSL